MLTFSIIGISLAIREAYGFICDNYWKNTDEIILIGFSRGAFTVRALASLIEDVGILRGQGRYYLSDIYNRWERQAEAGNLQGYVDQLSSDNLTDTGARIKACALWDTVAAVGFIPRRIPRFWSRKLGFINSRLCANIKNGYQALALDERRFHFQPIVCTQNGKPVKQCWFRGSHSDVGGGSKPSGLAA